MTRRSSGPRTPGDTGLGDIPKIAAQTVMHMASMGLKKGLRTLEDTASIKKMGQNLENILIEANRRATKTIDNLQNKAGMQELLKGFSSNLPKELAQGFNDAYEGLRDLSKELKYSDSTQEDLLKEAEDLVITYKSVTEEIQRLTKLQEDYDGQLKNAGSLSEKDVKRLKSRQAKTAIEITHQEKLLQLQSSKAKNSREELRRQDKMSLLLRLQNNEITRFEKAKKRLMSTKEATLALVPYKKILEEQGLTMEEAAKRISGETHQEYFSALAQRARPISSHLGGVVESVGNLWGGVKAHPIITGIVMATTAIYKLDKKLAEINKDTYENTKITGLYSQGWENAASKIKKLDVYGELGMSTNMISAKEFLELQGQILQSGVSLEDLYKKDAAGVSTMRKLVAITKVFGMDQQQVADIAGDWMLDLHENAGDMINDFLDLSKAQQESGLNASIFGSMVQHSTKDMDYFNKDISGATEVVKQLGQVGLFTRGQIEATMGAINNFFTKGTYSQRRMALILAGPEGITETVDMMRKDIQSTRDKLVKEIPEIANVPKGEDIEDYLKKNNTWEKLSPEKKKAILSVDIQQPNLMQERPDISGMQSFMNVGQKLVFLSKIFEKQNINLKSLTANAESQQYRQDLLDNVHMDYEATKNLLENEKLGFKTQKGTFYSIEELGKYVNDGNITTEEQAKRAKEVEDLLKKAAVIDSSTTGSLEYIGQQAGKATKYLEELRNFFIHPRQVIAENVKQLPGVKETIGFSKEVAKNVKQLPGVPSIQEAYKNLKMLPGMNLLFGEQPKIIAPKPEPKTPAPAPAPVPTPTKPVQQSTLPEDEMEGMVQSFTVSNAREIVSQIRKEGFQKYSDANVAATKEVAEKFHLDSKVMLAQLDAESSKGRRLISHEGALGPHQIMPDTGKQYGLKTLKDFFDPVKSAEAADKYMSFLLKKYNQNPALALAAYNTGEGNLDKLLAGKAGPKLLKAFYTETLPYVTKILSDAGISAPQITINHNPQYNSTLENVDVLAQQDKQNTSNLAKKIQGPALLQQ